MIYESTSDKPKMTEQDYIDKYTKQCVLIRGSQNWHKGTGIKIESHQLKEKISMNGCKSCSSKNVLVTAAQRRVHMFSGDIYWDFELFCKDCSRYAQRSYSENKCIRKIT